MLKSKNWMRMPFMGKNKQGKPQVLHYASEHVAKIMEAYGKVRMMVEEKERETASMYQEIIQKSEESFEIVNK